MASLAATGPPPVARAVGASSEIIKSIVREISQKASRIVRQAQQTQPAAGDGARAAAAEPWQVTDTLAAFMLRSVVLKPSNGFNLDQDLSRDDVEKLIQQCVALITATGDPAMEAVKMQVYFDTTFPAQADFLHREKQKTGSLAQPHLREIAEFRQKTVAGYEALYCKLVSYIMVKNQLDPATDLSVVRETNAALESVYPHSELAAFISMGRAERETQMNGLVHLVTGIRLFNRQLGKGGSLIEDLPAQCTATVAELVGALDAAADEARGRIARLEAHLLDPRDNRGDAPAQGQRLRAALVLVHQLAAYVKTLRELAVQSQKTLATLDERFQRLMVTLRDTCQSKHAVPVDQVYPSFISLAHVWSNYRDELYCAAFRRGMLDTLLLHTHACNWAALLEHVPEVPVPAPPAELDEDAVVANANALMAAVAVTNRQMEVLHPRNFTQYFALEPEYGGFCPVTLVATEGAVVPGDRALGVIRFHEKVFAFRSLEAARQFASNPQHYIESAVELAKAAPELVEMLQLYSYFPTVETLEKAKSYTRERLLGRVVVRSDSGSQTETHILDRHIDPAYQWNEWELRRQAIMLVNLRRKATHSTQTKSSTFRRDSETQVYEQRARVTQTVSDSSTQVAPMRQYLSGLRHQAGKPASFKVVDLTLEL